MSIKKNMLKRMKMLLRFLPDRLYLQLYYFAKFRKFIDFNNPKTYNEKIQWLKLYDRKAEYHQLVDKYEVRHYVSEAIGEQYLVPLLGVWESEYDVNFDTLPEEFVLKPTHASGEVIIVRNKSALDRARVFGEMREWLSRDYFWVGREWPYKDIKPRIVAEKLIDDQIVDYKFYCFNGEPKVLYLSRGLENHDTAEISFFDLDFKRMPFGRSDYRPFSQEPVKPDNYREMLDIVRKLAKDFSFIRVDLYSVSGQVYFSELTFYPAGGYMPFSPREWDNTLGEWIILPPR